MKIRKINKIKNGKKISIIKNSKIESIIFWEIEEKQNPKNFLLLIHWNLKLKINLIFKRDVAIN